MNLKAWMKKLVLTACVLPLTGFAATQKIVSSKPDFSVKAGDKISFDVKYAASSPQNTTGLGLKLYFDSSKLGSPKITHVYSQKKIAQAIVSDAANGDNDTATDKLFNIAWADLDKKWPGTTSGDTTLYTVEFTLASNFNAPTKIRFSAFTSAGNDFSAQPVTVSLKTDTADTLAPSITAPADKTIEARHKLTLLTKQDLGSPTVTDNKDPSPVVTFSPTEALPLGQHTINWSATDNANNTSTATQAITLVDTTPPKITPPGDKTVSATGAQTTIEIGQATVTDLVDDAPTLSSDATATFSVGKHTITWTAKDASGNTSTEKQIITVKDGDGPSISAPADITIEAIGKTTPVDLGKAIASDTVDGNLTATPDKKGPFSVGIHTITWTVKDSANNTATATQTVTVTDTTKPEIKLEKSVLKVNATGVRTSINNFGVSANDTVDGKLKAEGVELINGAEQAIPTTGFVSGNHQLLWRVTDKAGNKASIEQTLEITPLANFVTSQSASAGDTVKVTVELSGKPVRYPVTIPYTIDTDATTVANDGSDHTAKNGQVIIKQGSTRGSFSFKVADNPALNNTGKGNLVFKLGVPINAIAGTAKTHTVTLSANNIAPSVNLGIKQSGMPVSSATKNAGHVIITANARDNAAQTLSYDWSQTDAALNDLSADAKTFEFDPSALPEKTYQTVITVKDNGSPAKQTTVKAQIQIRAGATPVVDSDGDGIPDTTDKVPEPNRLPATAGGADKYILQSEPGTKLKLGNLARQQAQNGAKINTTGLPQIPEDYKNNNTEIYDFEIAGIAQGKSALIILPQSKPIPADAVYLKAIGNQWKPFKEDGDNAIYSAQRIREGVCPPTGDTKYKQGLKQGDYCVQLKIEDGGANDTDGLKNGNVADPGVVVAKASANTPPATTPPGSNPPTTNLGGSGGGGSFGWWFVVLLAGFGVRRRLVK